MRRFVWLLLLLAGCESDDVVPLAPGPAGNPGPVPARILVVNTLDWTLSSVDPDTGEMTRHAADAGAWANRVTRLIDTDGILVTSSGDNEIRILGARDLALRATIDVGPGSSPWTAVPMSSWEGLSTSWFSSRLTRLDLTSASAGATLETGPGPEGVAVTDRRAYVACTNWLGDGSFGPGQLDVVDLSTGRVVTSVTVGRNPQDVLIDDAGRVHVLCTGTYGAGPNPEEGSVHVVDPVTLQVSMVVPLGSSPGRLSAGADDTVWVVGESGGLRRYDAVSGSVLADPVDAALLAPGLSAVDWDDATGTAWVTSFYDDTLLGVDGTTLAVIGSWQTGDGPVDVLVYRED